MGTGGSRHLPTLTLSRCSGLVDGREPGAAGRGKGPGNPRGGGSIGEGKSACRAGGGGRGWLGAGLLHDDVTVECQLLVVKDFTLAEIETIEEIFLVDSRLGLWRVGRRAVEGLGRCCRGDGRRGKVVHGKRWRRRGGSCFTLALQLKWWGKGRCVWCWQVLALLELLETRIEVEVLGGQHEAHEVVVLALDRHAAAQARAHSRHRRAACAAGVASRASKADAEAALAPVEVVVLFVGRRARHRRLELEAAHGGAGELEVVAPVVVDLDLLGRLLLAEALDGAAQQRRRGHAGGDGDAGLFGGRRDGVGGRGAVIGGDEELPVVGGLGLGAHAHARGEALDSRVLEE